MRQQHDDNRFNFRIFFLNTPDKFRSYENEIGSSFIKTGSIEN